MLSPYRVLDLTDDRGFLCGKILADMGADVIKIERPGGDPSRNRGPFYQDVPHPERSLYWWSYNLNKRSITLNIETADGQDIFRKLVKKADFVIESFRVGYMGELGLSYSSLREMNPKIVVVSISPFGQTGPYRSYEATDIVGMAMGGVMYPSGDADRPPLRVSFDQAYLHASAQAAVGALIAHNHRQSTGTGQQVDVSMQQSLVVIPYIGVPEWVMMKRNIGRSGNVRSGVNRNASLREVWRCANGSVAYHTVGGLAGAKTNYALVRWMDNEGMADEFLKAIKWEEFDMATATQETHSKIEERVSRFFLKHTTKELYDGAAERGIMIFPVLPISGIAGDQQLKARDFWTQVEHPELCASFVYPGNFGRGTDPASSVKEMRRAPLIGEHNLEVYEGELGMSKGTLMTLKQAGII